MFSNYQVVILKEAQQMRSLEALEPYLANPVASSIFVICHKYKLLRKNSKLVKHIDKHGVVLSTKKLYDNKIPPWINSYLEANEYRIDIKASHLLVEFLGNDLSKIANELDKLMLNVEKGKSIDAAIVEKNIGISKDYNVFELQKALSFKDVLKANRIVQYFIANPRANPMVVITGGLFSYFSKVYKMHFLHGRDNREIAATIGTNPYFLDEYRTAARNYSRPKVEYIFRLLLAYDLKNKGVQNASISEGELMKEMIYRILH
jgi:DNA polymerase-3 subunit delta